jgi:hypothetical protein
VDVRWLRPVTREEEEPVRTTLENRRTHDGLILPVPFPRFQ